jgi:hypothetical protein
MDMAVRRLSSKEVTREAVEMLGLPAGTSITSAEALAAALRRAASFMCPTTATALVHATFDTLQGVNAPDDTLRERIGAVVDDLVSYGDILELEVEAQTRRQLFLGPPAYVRRGDSGTCFLLGVRPEGVRLLRDELMPSIRYVGYSRTIRLDIDDEVLEALDEDGLFAMQPEHWLGSPRITSAEELLMSYRERLDVLGLPGDVELHIVDPHSSVTYYRGRWRGVRRSDSGDFVARRPQAFGSDLWCFVRLAQGRVEKLIDLPVLSPLSLGFDEGWRLQAAIDATSGNEQRVRVIHSSDRRVTLVFYLPLPSWMQRRLDLIGVRSTTRAGGLFAYEMPSDELRDELVFLRDTLWTREEPEG